MTQEQYDILKKAHDTVYDVTKAFSGEVADCAFDLFVRAGEMIDAHNAERDIALD